jgi:carbon storage regulator CsrA
VLVLARKVDESILIGDDIHVKIISIEKGVVKIGIEAPNDVRIIRDELAKDIADANKEASKHTFVSELSTLKKLLKKK